MSRPSILPFPENLNLPRRRFLQAMTAVALPSVVISPTSGQAFPALDFSGVGKGLAAAIAADPRFARFDDLVSDIVDLELRQNEALADYDDETIAFCDAEGRREGAEPWCKLYGTLVKEMKELAEANNGQGESPLDVVLQMKIADYYFAIGDVGFLKTNEICAVAARNALLLLGLKHQNGIDQARKTAAVREMRTEPKQVPAIMTPLGVNAGNLIIRIRDLKDTCREAGLRACSLVDDTPEWLAADAEATQLENELEALRDEIIAGVNRSPDDRSVDHDRFRMSQTHRFAVWIELIEAMYPAFFDDVAHGPLLPVLQQMREEAPSLSDEFIEHATRWNACNVSAAGEVAV